MNINFNSSWFNDVSLDVTELVDKAYWEIAKDGIIIFNLNNSVNSGYNLNNKYLKYSYLF